MACCPEGSLPSLQTSYEPRGKEIKVKDLDAYLVGQGSRALIVAYDIYGFGRTSGRARAVCDQLANEGFLVIMPDFFRGTAWPVGKTFDDTMGTWLKTMPYEPQVCSDVHANVVPYLREQHGAKCIGMAGFCWGAWLIQKVSSVPEVLSCGVSFHPSLQIEETLFGGSIDEMIGAVKCPQLLMPAGNDLNMVQAGGQVITKLKASDIERVRDGSRIHAFPDMMHGFMLKAALDVGDEKVKRDVSAAFRLAVDYFNKYMGEL